MGGQPPLLLANKKYIEDNNMKFIDAYKHVMDHFFNYTDTQTDKWIQRNHTPIKIKDE